MILGPYKMVHSLFIFFKTFKVLPVQLIIEIGNTITQL